MVVVIDRFEDEYAVVELSDGSMMNIPKRKVPGRAKEGDVLVIEEGSIWINEKETAKRKAQADELIKKIWSE